MPRSTTSSRQCGRYSTKGYELAGLALTHRHLAEHGPLLRRISEIFGVPVLMHPRDVATLRSVTPGVAFQDPAGHHVPAAFGLETVFFPGHTEGHVMYYRADDGLLITGDAAMSTTRAQAAEGVARLLRPPFSFNTDDAQLRHGWEAFSRPVRHVLPFHGALITDRSPEDMRALMQPLQREEPTDGMAG